MKWKLKALAMALVGIILSSCKEDPTPKPKGYPRIDLEDRTYQKWENDCPFSFKVSSKAKMNLETKANNPCFWNLKYEQYNATLHMSYAPIKEDLKKLIDQEYKMREKHNAFATRVKERILQMPEKKVNAMVFDIEGTKAATPLQFFVTDSTTHFYRGTLYFYNTPNNDSLAPVIQYIKTDIDTLLESFEWK